jgi:hypothetical protein
MKALRQLPDGIRSEGIFGGEGGAKMWVSGSVARGVSEDEPHQEHPAAACSPSRGASGQPQGVISGPPGVRLRVRFARSRTARPARPDLARPGMREASSSIRCPRPDASAGSESAEAHRSGRRPEAAFSESGLQIWTPTRKLSTDRAAVTRSCSHHSMICDDTIGSPAAYNATQGWQGRSGALDGAPSRPGHPVAQHYRLC